MTKSQGKGQEWEGWVVLKKGELVRVFIYEESARAEYPFWGDEILPVLIVPRKGKK